MQARVVPPPGPGAAAVPSRSLRTIPASAYGDPQARLPSVADEIVELLRKHGAKE
jgi:hypothetical protein